MALPLTEEERKFLQSEGEASKLVPLRQEDMAFLNDETAEPEEATFGQKVAHVAGGPLQGAIDATIDLPYNLTQIWESAEGVYEDYISPIVPDVVEEAVGTAEKYLPITPFGGGFLNEAREEYLPGVLSGQERVSDLPGLRQAREFLVDEKIDREQAPLADSARTLGEYAVGGVANLARKASALPDLVSGAGAALGEVAEEYLTDGDPSGFGEAVGSLAGLVAGKPRVPKADRADYAAFKYIEEHADNPQQAIANLREALARGDEGSLASLTGDNALLNIEMGGAQDPKFRQQLEEVDANLQAQISERVQDQLSDASPGSDAIDASNQVDQVEYMADATADAQKTAADQAADAAKVQANEAGLPLATTQRPAQTSARLHDDYNQAEAEFKAEVEDPAWTEFRESTATLSMEPVFANIDETLNNLDPAEALSFRKKHGGLINESNVWDSTDEALEILGPDGKPITQEGPRTGRATPNDFSDWIRRINERIEDAGTKPDGTLNREGVLLAQVRDSAQDGLEQSSGLYAAARDATRTKNQQYRPGRVGDVRSTKSTGPETFTGQLNLKGNSGARIIREIKQSNDPRLVNDVVEHLKAEAAAADGVDAKFLDTYRDVIDALPEQAQAQFYDTSNKRGLAQAASQRADDVAKTADAEAQGLKKAVQGESFYKFSQNPDKVLDMEIDELADLKANLEVAGSLDNLKGRIRDLIEDKYFVSPEGLSQARTKDLVSFRKDLNKLKESGILTDIEVNAMLDEFSRSGTLQQRKNALSRTMDLQGQEFDQLAASGLSAVIMNVLPFGGSESLMMGGALRRFIRKKMTGAEVKADQVKALEEMILNPEKYVTSADKFKTLEDYLNAIYTRAVAVGQTAAAVQEEE